MKTKADVLALLGEPDRIVQPSQRMKSTAWKCAECMKTHRFPEPVSFPDVCDCGSNSFLKT